MEPYTDMKYSDCGCGSRCRRVSQPQPWNQPVRSCLDPAMQAENRNRSVQMNWEGNTFCPGSMPGTLEKDKPLAMAYVPWQQWQTPYMPERGLAQGTIFPELDLPFDKGRCS